MPIGIGASTFGDVGAGVDRFDAVHLLGGAGVDRRDRAVRDVAALERQVLHAGDLEVVDVGAAALDQARVLAALDALADQLRQNGSRSRHGYLAAFRRRVRGVLNGVDDVLVAGAAAEVAGDALANLLLARRRVVAAAG